MILGERVGGPLHNMAESWWLGVFHGWPARNPHHHGLNKKVFIRDKQVVDTRWAPYQLQVELYALQMAL